MRYSEADDLRFCAMRTLFRVAALPIPNLMTASTEKAVVATHLEGEFERRPYLKLIVWRWMGCGEAFLE
jgi:hypothetical protein